MNTITLGDVLTIIVIIISVGVQYSAIIGRISKLEGTYGAEITNVKDNLKALHKIVYDRLCKEL